MRYRIVIEIETDQGREFVNRLAQHCFEETITRESNPLYLSTEAVEKTIVHIHK